MAALPIALVLKGNSRVASASMRETLIHRWVEEANTLGQIPGPLSPRIIRRLESGWAVLSVYQGFRGYSMLLPDPVVPSLNALTADQRQIFLNDMGRLGDALLEVTHASRINYEILGNAEPALHAHLIPRYHHEPISLRCRPAWFSDMKTDLYDQSRDESLREAINRALGTGTPVASEHRAA